MPDDTTSRERQRILERADRMLQQSKTLRQLSDELLEESEVIRKSVKRVSRTKQSHQKRR